MGPQQLVGSGGRRSVPGSSYSTWSASRVQSTASHRSRSCVAVDSFTSKSESRVAVDSFTSKSESRCSRQLHIEVRVALQSTASHRSRSRIAEFSSQHLFLLTCYSALSKDLPWWSVYLKTLSIRTGCCTPCCDLFFPLCFYSFPYCCSISFHFF